MDLLKDHRIINTNSNISQISVILYFQAVTTIMIADKEIRKNGPLRMERREGPLLGHVLPAFLLIPDLISFSQPSEVL